QNIDSNSKGLVKTNQEPKSGFFKRIFDMILGKSDPKWEKRRLLRDIDKSIRRMRQKYYSPRNYSVLPQLAKFFYEFYKTLGPAKTLVQHADSSGALKIIVIESFLSSEHSELKNRFKEEAIRERVKITDTKKLTEELKQELLDFFSGFDAEKIRLINAHYNFLRKFLNLAHFDYYFLLKKFDSNLPEGNFFYKPSFEAVNGEYIVDELKDFLDVALAIDESINWNIILDILKEYRGVEVVSRNGWQKLLTRLKEIQRTKILELILQHIDNDPFYKPNPHIQFIKIVEPYLSKIKTQTELTIQKLAKEKQGIKIEFLCNKIFGTTSVLRMKNYNEQKNEIFKKKMLGGFIHITPINYVKAFLIDYNKKTIRDVVDLLIVKGKWTTNILSQQLSDSFQQLSDITEELLEFDEALSDDSPDGTKLKNMAMRADRDKKANRLLRQMLKETNDTAKKIMYDAAQGLIILAKNLKALLDDYSKQPHELIINWKEIDTHTDNTIKERIINIYKHIYYFIKLLQIYNR
ncbi:MAG: hypothetical protein JXJ04_19145, partial [Spirochaetales bacterium]|nr:hypothetical protein [Spirochaetales bacterium]